MNLFNTPIRVYRTAQMCGDHTAPCPEATRVTFPGGSTADWAVTFKDESELFAFMAKYNQLVIEYYDMHAGPYFTIEIYDGYRE